MLFELILLLMLGILFIVLGGIIWKKEKIDLINSSHCDKVEKKNIRPYTALMGKGMIVIGAGMVFTGWIDFFTRSGWGWIAFGFSFVVGLSFFIYAGRKYNR